MAEVAVSGQMFNEILILMSRLRASPAPAVKGLRIKCDGQGRLRRASMKASQRAPAPARQATRVGCAWHPSRWKIVALDAHNQTIALAGAGIVKCRLNPSSPTPRIRGCTYCTGANKASIWADALGTSRLAKPTKTMGGSSGRCSSRRATSHTSTRGAGSQSRSLGE